MALTAIRTSDGTKVIGAYTTKTSAPFHCPECHKEMILRECSYAVDHFAHKADTSCGGTGESEQHLLCKFELFKALSLNPAIKNCELERSLGQVRPDLSFYLRDDPVAIEVQASSIPLPDIIRRTKAYHRLGIAVLWVNLGWDRLGLDRFIPQPWEQWLHAFHFGRIFYWMQQDELISYSYKQRCSTNFSTYYGITTRRLKSKTAVRNGTFRVADLYPTKRKAWTEGPFEVPEAFLLIDRKPKWAPKLNREALGRWVDPEIAAWAASLSAEDCK